MPDQFLFRNFAVSSLTAGVVPGQTTIFIAPEDVYRFPAPLAGQAFPIVLADDTGLVEVLYCTAIADSGACTVTRAREDTGEYSWPAGTVVQHVFTAETIFSFGTLNPRGTYNAATAYKARDLVLQGGLSFVAVVDNQGSAPDILSPVWQVLYNPVAAAGSNLLWGGEWNNLSTFAPGAVVNHDGVLWRAATASTGVEPVEGTYWKPFARPSQTGAAVPPIVATGTNNYEVTIPNGDVLYDGMEIKLQVLNANTAACTLRINANTPVPFRRAPGQAFAASELVPGQILYATFLAATNQFVSQAGATADAFIAAANARMTAIEAVNTQQALDLTNYAAASDPRFVPAGAIQHFYRQTAPGGWLEANGAAVSRTTYATLFAAIGTTAGAGDGSTTFNLPDLRGEFIRSWDHGRGLDGGRAFGDIQGQTIQSHNHAVTDPGHVHPISDPGHQHSYADNQAIPAGPQNASSGAQIGFTDVGKTTGASTTGVVVQSAGTGISIQNTGSTETRPRNISLLVCIKF